MLVQPLPYLEPEALVEVAPHRQLSRAEYVRLEESATRFTGTSAHVSGFAVRLVDDAPAEQLIVAIVSAGHFAVVGVAPSRGRAFVVEDSLPGAPPVGIISDSLWRRRYGGDPSIVGRTVPMDGLGEQVGEEQPVKRCRRRRGQTADPAP